MAGNQLTWYDSTMGSSRTFAHTEQPSCSRCFSTSTQTILLSIWHAFPKGGNPRCAHGEIHQERQLEVELQTKVTLESVGVKHGCHGTEHIPRTFSGEGPTVSTRPGSLGFGRKRPGLVVQCRGFWNLFPTEVEEHYIDYPIGTSVGS